MDYIWYCFGLSCCLYWAPAFALYPKIIRNPAQISAAPIVSVLCICTLTTLLLAMGVFTQTVVWSITAGITLIAGMRIYGVLSTGGFTWSATAKRTSFINFLIILPYAVHLGTTGFDRDDEIYSWNYWALQYVQGIAAVDFANTTVVPYPQFFSKWLAYAYQWLGDTQLQLPLRATLAWFPFCTLQAISFVAKESPGMEWLTRIGLIFVLYGTNVQRYFENGYADPLMTASLLSSVAFFCHYLRERKSASLWFSVICGITAAYTKQPGLYWIAVALPLCLISVKGANTCRQRMAAIGMLLSAALYWWWSEGHGFQQNDGVLNASFQGRTLYEQLIFSLNKYFMHLPVFLMVFLASAWAVYRASAYRLLWIVWLLPSTLLWFIFGAYHLRLGVHNVLGALLILAATDFHFMKSRAIYLEKLQKHVVSIVLSMTILSFSIAFFQFYRADLMTRTAPNIYYSGEVVMRKYFGLEWPWIYANLYNKPNILLWCPSDYIYGLFYSRTPIVRPEYARYANPTDPIAVQRAFRAEMEAVKPDYIFTLGELPTRGAFISKQIEVLAIEHPDVFEAVASPPNRYGYVTYRLHLENW